MANIISEYVPKKWFGLKSSVIKDELSKIEALANKREECSEDPEYFEFFFETEEDYEEAERIIDCLEFLVAPYFDS